MLRWNRIAHFYKRLYTENVENEFSLYVLSLYSDAFICSLEEPLFQPPLHRGLIDRYMLRTDKLIYLCSRMIFSSLKSRNGGCINIYAEITNLN